MGNSALMEQVSEDEFKDFIGPKAYEFTQVREDILAKSKRPRWSWFMFLFGPYWAIYRKWWIVALAAVVGYAGIGPVAVALFHLFFGAYGKRAYANFVAKQVLKLKKLEQDPKRLSAALAERGRPTFASSAMVPIFILTTALAVSTSVALTGFLQEASALDENGLPECASKKSVSSVKKILANTRAQLIELNDIVDEGGIFKTPKKECSALALTTAGKIRIWYTIEPTNNGQHYFEVKQETYSDVLKRDIRKNNAERERNARQSETPPVPEPQPAPQSKANYLLNPDPVVMQQGADAFENAYRSEGLMGVRAEREDCYRQYETDQSEETLLRCISFDILSSFLIRQFEQENNFPPEPDFQFVPLTLRLEKYLRPILPADDDIISVRTKVMDQFFSKQ